MPQVRAEFEKLCPSLSLTYSSSPYGDRSLWLEIFPPEVSKGCGAACLAKLLNLNSFDCLSLGNDFNDLDLLKWTKRSLVTLDATEPLPSEFQTVPPSDDSPLSWLVDKLEKFEL
jgi:hydroxymethylpyrimidine pyrophosphatase-like HAD family hydrolase